MILLGRNPEKSPQEGGIWRGSQNQQGISSRCISIPLLGSIYSGDLLDVLSNLRRYVLREN